MVLLAREEREGREQSGEWRAERLKEERGEEGDDFRRAHSPHEHGSRAHDQAFSLQGFLNLM